MVLNGFTAAGEAARQTADGARVFETGTFSVETRDPWNISYLIHRPAAAASEPGRKWPLIFFLHGAGERGADVQRVAIHGPLRRAEQQADLPFFIVAPQCPAGERWNAELLAKLLDQIESSEPVDRSRVYLTGLSMGGFGTWELGLLHAERFAAIAPICGGGNRIDVMVASQSKAEAFRSLPIRAYHGARDELVPPDESRRMIDAVQRAGNRHAELLIHPQDGHDSWTRVYADPQFYQWLLRHRREGRS